MYQGQGWDVAAERLLSMIAARQAEKAGKDILWQKLGIPIMLEQKNREEDRQAQLMQTIIRYKEEKEQKLFDFQSKYELEKLNRENENQQKELDRQNDILGKWITKMSGEGGKPEQPPDFLYVDAEESTNRVKNIVDRIGLNAKDSTKLDEVESRVKAFETWSDASSGTKKALAKDDPKLYGIFESVDDRAKKTKTIPKIEDYGISLSELAGLKTREGLNKAIPATYFEGMTDQQAQQEERRLIDSLSATIPADSTANLQSLKDAFGVKDETISTGGTEQSRLSDEQFEKMLKKYLGE